MNGVSADLATRLVALIAEGEEREREEAADAKVPRPATPGERWDITRTQLSQLIQEQALRGVFLEQVLHSAPQKGAEIPRHSQLWALVPMQQRPVIIEDHFSADGSERRTSDGGKPKINAKEGIREQLDTLESVLGENVPDDSSDFVCVRSFLCLLA